MSKPRIGFIGLGLMGSAMVERLQDRGYSLTVLGNVSRPNVDAAVERGGIEAANARELAQASDIVMLCMGTSDEVESRMLGDDGVVAGLNPDTVVIDFGTSLPNSTKKLGEMVAEKRCHMLDAPLGRTPSHGREGKLNIMGAGDRGAFDRVKPVLDDLGENVFHLGPLGSGHTIKLINNFFAMTTASAMSEAFAVADAAGIPRQQLYDVVSAGPLHSGMMDFVKAYCVDGDPNKLAFSVRNAKKDIGYYARMTGDLGFESVVSPGPKKLLGDATDGGFGDLMVPQLVDYLKSRK